MPQSATDKRVQSQKRVQKEADIENIYTISSVFKQITEPQFLFAVVAAETGVATGA